MFRRARLSVKPNVRPGVGARGSTAGSSQRGHEPPRPPEPEPAAPPTPKPAEPADVTPVDLRAAEPQEKAPRSSTDEKTDGDSDVQESNKSSSTASQRRKRLSSASSPIKPNDSVPPESCPLPTVNQEAQQPNPIPAKEKQPCSDRYRIYKAQKLREMLREELRKEKKQWKQKYALNESQRPPDRSKMTMRDFIYYLPDSNPMTSSLEQEKKNEKPLTTVQPREQEGKNTPDAGDHEEIEEEPDDGPLLVPRVKVAEDGSIILDEESLTVEVLRTKGPCVVEENDPIFERGSTTTYSSFRKNYYSKPWSNKETDMFFLAISMVGTDFSMIGQLFPHRERIEIKNKFKREEKTNGWRIDKAFQEKRPFDFDFFAHLLQKVLAEEEKRKQKSVKSQNSQEKKSSRPRKNVKAKKVVSEAVNDDSEESVSTKIPNTGQSQKDAQSIEEEHPLTLLEQDSEQNASEPNLNQKKRRKKSQNEIGEQQVRDHSGNTTVQPDPSGGEIQDSNCESLRPEVNDVEANKQKEVSCVQNTGDIVDLFPREKIEKRTDPILSSSSQDAISVGNEALESSASDLPSSEVEITMLCEVDNAVSTSTEENNVDLKSKTLQADQIENVKPALRGRRQRPKPNLSRASGKKLVVTQEKADVESQSSHLEVALEKDSMDKDKINTPDISEMENIEAENPDAETNSSEKICLPQDKLPKAFKPVRQMRGRLQRPKPNVCKAAERKITLASQEKEGLNVENNENESCISRDADEPSKILDCEDNTTQPEKNDTFQNMPPDETTPLNECASTHKDDKSNKQVQILKTRFQKPKPNVGRGTGRRKMFSKEEVPIEMLASEKITAASGEVSRQETSPGEVLPEEAATPEDTELDLKESGSSGIVPREEIPEIIDTPVEMETDWKETRRENCPSEKIGDVTEAIEERGTNLEQAEGKEIHENTSEEASSGEAEIGLKEIETSPKEKGLVETSAIREGESYCSETGQSSISLMKKVAEKVTDTEKTEADLALIFPRENELLDIGPTGEKEITLNETVNQDTSLMEKPSEMVPDIVETKADSKGACTREELLVGVCAFQEKEIILHEEAIRDTSQMEKATEMLPDTRETETHLKESSPREEFPEGISGIREKITLHESSTRDTSLMEKASEMVTGIEESEADLRESSPREELLVGISAFGENVTLNETAIRDSSLMGKTLEMVIDMEKVDTDLRESSPREELLVGTGVLGEKITLNETATSDTSQMEKTSEMVIDMEETAADLKESSTREEELLVGISAAGEKFTLHESATSDTSVKEKASEMVTDIEETEAGLKETSPREDVLVGISTFGEQESTSNEAATRDTFFLEEASEVEMDAEGTKADLKETSPKEELLLGISAFEKEITLCESATRDTSVIEKAPEMVMDIDVKETDLKESSPRKELLVEISAFGEITLNEAVTKDTSLLEKAPEMTTDIRETEANLKEPSPRKEVLVGLSPFEEREITLNGAAARDTSLLEKTPEIVTDIKEIDTECKSSPMEELPEGISTVGERESTLNEAAARDTSLLEKAPEMVTDIKETDTECKESSPMEELLEGISTVGEREITLNEAAARDTSLLEKASEMVTDIRETEANLKESSPKKEVLVGLSPFEERESTLNEAAARDTSLLEKTPEIVTDIKEIDTECEESSPMEELPEGIGTVGERESTLNEAAARDTSLLEKAPEMVTDIKEIDTECEESSPMEELPEEISTVGEREITLNEAAARSASLLEKAPVTVTDIKEIKADFKECSPKEELLEAISAFGDKITLNETATRDVSLMEKASEMVTDIVEGETSLTESSLRELLAVGISAFGEKESTLNEASTNDTSQMETENEDTVADMKETTVHVSLIKDALEEISASGEMVQDMKQIENISLSPKENESEETGASSHTETDLMQSSSDDYNIIIHPSVVQNVSAEVMPIVRSSTEENSSEKEVSSSLHHSPLQTFECDITENQGKQFPDTPNTHLSTSFQEQKQFEVKATPFVRSRFKRPKPNLARAVLKRDNVETKRHVLEKKLETDKTESIVIQQINEQMNILPSQHDATSTMTSREKNNSDQKQAETVTSSCIQTEKDLSSSCVLEEEAHSIQAQEKTHTIKTSPKEMKGSITQTALPVRGRLQRPKPNIRNIGRRHLVEKVEAKVTVEEERTKPEQEETKKEFLTVARSQIGNEIEVVSSKIPECSMNDVSDEKIRHEHKTPCLNPPPLIRRPFQKAKPNLGRARPSKKEDPCIEKNRICQSETKKPEDNLQQQGDCDTQLLQKEKNELLTSLEVSAKRDHEDSSKEDDLTKIGAPSEGEPSGIDIEKTVGDSSTSSVAEEQYLSKLTSCPQLLKEPNHSKITLDRRTAVSSVSECKIDRSERRTQRKIKPNVTRGRGSKRARSKASKKEPRPSKPMLVTLRASQEEDEDDDEDYEPYYEDEIYHLAPEEVNKAPVFVPVGLRSPAPVPVRIQETMEELEITVNAPDVECIAIVEPQLSDTDVTTQEIKPEGNLNALSVELTSVEHTQDETGTNDGSAEAAITLLTMGDLVLQSEIDTEQGDGIWILPDLHPKDKNHISFSPVHVEHRITHDHQELSLPVNNMPLPSLEENKIVLEERHTEGEVGLVEKLKENSLSTRNETYEVTSNLRKRSRFDAHQEVSSDFTAQEEDIHNEAEKNASEATNLDDQIPGLETIGENKEQHQLACMQNIEDTSHSQDANLTERNEGQEKGSHEVQFFSVDPVSPSSTFDSDGNLGECTAGEPLSKESSENSLLPLHVPECIPNTIPDTQGDVINSQDLVHVLANVDEANEDEHTFILTLVEIPTDGVDFTDSSTQLWPNTFLPAPILIKSVNAEERTNTSMSFPVTSFSQEALCFSNSERDDPEQLPVNTDLLSRKRTHCELDEGESDSVPPTKKCSLISSDGCQTYTSEVCSKELVNAFEVTGMPCEGQSSSPTSESIPVIPESQKEQSGPSTFQSTDANPIDKVIDTYREKNTFQLPQDKEERTRTASKSEQTDSKTSSSKAPLSRPGRRPLGFLSLICSKNSLESDEPTQIRSKKRLKPYIPTSRQNLKRPNLLSANQEKNQKSSDLCPSSNVGTQSETASKSTTQVSSLPKEECKSGQKRATGEELTTISEYFFNDIFIEVDEPE